MEVERICKHCENWETKWQVPASIPTCTARVKVALQWKPEVNNDIHLLCMIFTSHNWPLWFFAYW